MMKVGVFVKDNFLYWVAKAMGWSEGQGLGRDNQGIIDPIKVVIVHVNDVVISVLL